MDPARGAVGFAIFSTSTAGELHVIPVVTQTSHWVIARREVDVSTKRRGIAITVLVWKAHASAFVIRIGNSNTVKAV